MTSVIRNSRTTNKEAIIAGLNDDMRTSLTGKCRMCSDIGALDANTRNTIIEHVMAFTDFNEDNDPYGEHDCSIVNVPKLNMNVMFKFDYYDAKSDMSYLSPDPSDPIKTVRVMTISMAL
jgi:hypothetical protein